MKTLEKKVLIVGLGSIGERYFQVVESLMGIKPAVFRQTDRVPRFCKPDMVFRSWNEVKGYKPEISIICNPTSLHVESALNLLKIESHVLIEKPFSNSSEKLAELESLAEEKGVFCRVAYMMRYHPLILKMKEILDSDSLGSLLTYDSFWGEFLPDWHPWEDFRSSYAARKDLGGGAALTLSHELDLIQFLFPQTQLTRAQSYKEKRLGLDVDECSQFHFNLGNRVAGEVSVNFWDKPPRRETIVGFQKGFMRFDYLKQVLEINQYDGQSKFERLEKFDRNFLFENMLKDFIEGIPQKKCQLPDLKDSAQVVEWAQQALANPI